MSLAIAIDTPAFVEINLDSEKQAAFENERAVAKVSRVVKETFQGISETCVDLWERKEAWLNKVEGKCYPIGFVLKCVEDTFTTPFVLVYRTGKYTCDGTYRKDVNTSVRTYMHESSRTQKASDMGKVFIKVGSSLTVSTILAGAIAFGNIPVVLSIVGASTVGIGLLESSTAKGIQSYKENEGLSEMATDLKENLKDDAIICLEGVTYGAISGSILGGVLTGVVAASSSSSGHAATARPGHVTTHSAHSTSAAGAPLDKFRNSGGDALLTVTALRVGPHSASISNEVLEGVKGGYETISTVNDTLDSAEKKLDVT